MTNIDLDALQALAKDARTNADGWDADGCPGPWETTHKQSDAIDSLIARIRELEGDTGKSAEADTARLDFLDGNLKFKMGWSVRAAPVGNLSVSSIIMGGKPIREAVDAAISAGRAAPESACLACYGTGQIDVDGKGVTCGRCGGGKEGGE